MKEAEDINAAAKTTQITTTETAKTDKDSGAAAEDKENEDSKSKFENSDRYM